MTRKLFALLLACLLILMSFTACGSKTPEADTTAAENTTAAEVNAQTSAEETSSEAVSESAEGSTAQNTQKPTADKPASKPATTAKSNNSGSASKGKLEVSAGSVKSIAGAKVLRAWKLNSNGVNIEIHRIAYGPQITQAFKKANADGAIDYDKTVTYQPVVNIAIITCSPEHIGVASSQQLLGTNVGKVEDMGRKSGALIAINGEAGSTYKKGAPTIRSGSVVSTDGSGQKRLLIYRNGTWKVETLTNENCKSYISQGVYNSLRYQWQVITNGKATNEHDTYYHNRTVFAQISENKYIIYAARQYDESPHSIRREKCVFAKRWQLLVDVCQGHRQHDRHKSDSAQESQQAVRYRERIFRGKRHARAQLRREAEAGRTLQRARHSIYKIKQKG